MAIRVSIPDKAKEVLSQWYDRTLIEDAPVLRRSFIGWLFGVFGQHAVTINKTVHLTQNATDDLESDYGITLIGHELFHVLQQRESGWWRFLGRYVLGWRPSHIVNGTNHPIEKPAYELENEMWLVLRRPKPPPPSP